MNILKKEKLIKIRKENNLSQYDMAKKLNMTQSYYCQIELGQKKLTYQTALKIAKIFNKKPDDIFYSYYK